MTHTHCTECKRRIPWGEPRTIIEIREGWKVTRRNERCMPCGGWVIVPGVKVKDAAAKP
ncbi:hypothetical protein LCGC14_0382470 [marine sediment metagenome]|uniref:DUF5679 domain-containing protein n=1 Tax=marine sediment metagenome TaxID=412755 RepID=A0A0F9WAR9_9ZZZZ